MPDHMHLLLSLGKSYKKSLIDWVSAFKRYTSRKVNESFELTPLWQKNFYDHVVRHDESIQKIAEYIVNNPVRKGIVNDCREYPYCGMADPFLF
jgi:putative transposase